ncbi:c-type cytochrome [Mycoavidus sp. B2-EB]|uniref:c-type cytochrome n=1 Tax=Mycoavidus sp. B2-EB TaxID=2651972 RepID=UPI001626A9F3|nr:c-type cytochrome [Mycoavidus sp. B2-EB]BBO59861.1 cytochrome [Mycoavidus sp. B2-EB]
MSETSHDTLIKTPRQLIRVVIASFLIPVVGILLLIEYFDNTYRAGAGTDAMSHTAIAQRIAPIAQLEINEAVAPAFNLAATVTPAQASPATASAAMAALSALPTSSASGSAESANLAQAGKALYTKFCIACHGTGVMDAPKFGDKTAWAPRLKESMETIYNYALHGKGNMLPKGGSNAPDAEVKAAVDYMIHAVK